MAIHIGHARAGWPGLIVAGVCFIVPAMSIVLALAWAYVTYGTLPQAGALLYGVKPVIIAVVLQALWSLGRAAVKGPLPAIAGLIALILYLRGVNEIAVLAGIGTAVMLAQNARRVAAGAAAGLLAPGLWASQAIAQAATAATAGDVPFNLVRLFGIMVKIGAVLYGGGYVLLAFLRGDLVVRLGWLSDQQLLDAVAVGQVTPGPVFTTATFVGYLLGVPAALLATLGIFLPAFVFVAASHPFIPRLRRSPWAGALLDGVNVASLAPMAGVTWHLGQAAIVDPLTAFLALGTLGLLVRWRWNSAWLVAGGGGVGLLAWLFQR